VQAGVDWFGPIDFVHYGTSAASGPAASASTSPMAKFLGCALDKCDASVLRASNPINFINASTPPMLIMHGKEDKLVPYQQSQEFYDSLKAKGVKATLILEPGAGHGWEGASPEASKEIYEKAYRFFDETIGNKAK
jgi:dipeptidyl aminopeptidase/acylaminoacyl peptidase